MILSSNLDKLPLFAIVLQMTWQASIVIVLILTFQRLLGRRLPPAWRHALWSLVFLRLLLPVFPESRLSLFNIDFSVKSIPIEPPETSAPVSVQVAATPPVAASTPLPKDPPPSVSHPTHPVEPITSLATTAPDQSTPSAISHIRAWQQAAVLWLLGILFLAFRTANASLRLCRQLRRCGPATDPHLLKVADECRRQLGMTRLPRFVIVPPDSEPGIVGLFRPTVMIPQSLLAASERADLQHVILHELVHLTRGDLLWNWLGLLACHLHWFNPLVWYAARRARFDAELACDAHALANLPPQQRLSYGETLLHLLEQSTTPPSMRQAVPLLAHRHDLHRRITMIAGYEGPSYRGTLCGLASITILCLLGLTQAVGETPPASSASPTSAAEKSLASPTQRTTKPAATPTKTASAKTVQSEPDLNVPTVDTVVRDYLSSSVESGLIVPEIRHLQVRDNAPYVRLRGPKLKDSDLEELARHPEIVHVAFQDVENIRGPGLQVLARLPKLKSLAFLGMKCSDDLVLSTPRLPNVTSLSLVACNTTGKSLKALTQFPNLAVLNLRMVAIDSGMENFRHVPNVNRLTLMNNDISDAGFKHFASLPNVTMLYLNGPASFTDAGMTALKSMTRLESVHLQDLAIKGSGLANLTGTRTLLYLSLGGESVNDDWISALLPLKSVVRLELYRGSVSCRQLAKLRDWRRLSQLTLIRRMLKPEDVQYLAELIQLHVLMIPELGPGPLHQQLREALPNAML